MKWILVALIACSSPPQQPAQTVPAPAPTGSATEPTPTPTPAPGSGAKGPGIGEKCGANDACGEGTCVSYFVIAGARGPQFKTCEIKCDKATPCPKGRACTTIADGPGQV